MILVVDDQHTILEMICELLDREGYPHRTFLSGEQALSWISKTSEHIALLITDYDMPGMTGSDLIDAARRLRPDLQSLLLSGTPGISPPHKSRFLAKPFVISEFIDMVAELVRWPAAQTCISI